MSRAVLRVYIQPPRSGELRWFRVGQSVEFILDMMQDGHNLIPHEHSPGGVQAPGNEDAISSNYVPNPLPISRILRVTFKRATPALTLKFSMQASTGERASRTIAVTVKAKDHNP